MGGSLPVWGTVVAKHRRRSDTPDMTDHDSLLKTPLYVLGSEAMRDCLLDKAKDTHDAVDGVRLVEEWAIADTPAGVLLISATGNGLLRPTTDERPALVDVFVDSTRTCAASPSRARLTASELSEFLTGAHVAFGDFVRTSSGRQR